MFEIVKSGGWMMWPIILASIAAMAIILERLWSLRAKQVTPPDLIPTIQDWLARKELDMSRINYLRSSSPLGRVLASALANRAHDAQIIKDAVEDTGRHVTAELERYLNTLGTIAGIAPFLGLLGTVLGMIQMFSGLGTGGIGDPAVVARGIAQALITTAAGLVVAIPALMFYRYFRGRVNLILVEMEQQAIALIEMLKGHREQEA